MEVKMVPASQFGNQLQVNWLKNRRELNQEKIERLRRRMSKIRREIQDYEAANRKATVEICNLEDQINDTSGVRMDSEDWRDVANGRDEDNRG